MLEIELIQQIESDYPCRSTQLSSLDALIEVTRDHGDASALSLPRETRSPSILVYGPHFSGKSSIVRALLGASDQHNFAYIDCKQCMSARSLYERTIDEILERKLVTDADGTLVHESISIETLDLFMLEVNNVLQAPEQQAKTIVFDHFSRRSYEECPSIMQAINNLLESIPGNHMAVFVVSHYDDIPSFALPVVRFDSYKADEICYILQETTKVTLVIDDMNIKDEEELKGLWDRFCKTFCSAFFDILGQELPIYRSIALKLFPQYLQPIKDNILSAKNHVQLARSAQALLNPEPWLLAEQSFIDSKTSESSQIQKPDELSVCARYLLIASFLASYNPGRTDSTYFSRGKGDKTKRRSGKSAANAVSKQPQKLLGPKGFTLERMTSIFQAIVPTNYSHTALFDQQIASLASLRLILKQGNGADLLDDGKWLVNVSFETIMKLAQGVRFELHRFLVSE